jgi:hypothetical protein
VLFSPQPQGPANIRTIRGGEAALDAFLRTETTRPPTPTTGQSEPTGHTPTTRGQRVKTSPRNGKRSSTPPPQPPTQWHNHPSLPARPPRRVHTDLLQIIMEEGDPDRDSVPRE